MDMDMARIILDVFGQVAFSAWPYRFFDLLGKRWVPVIDCDLQGHICKSELDMAIETPPLNITVERYQLPAGHFCVQTYI
jgi:hypothetical protein